MNPPSSDAKGPGTPTGAQSATTPKPDAAKPELGKPDLGKPELEKPTALSSGSAKPALGTGDAAKAVADAVTIPDSKAVPGSKTSSDVKSASDVKTAPEAGTITGGPPKSAEVKPVETKSAESKPADIKGPEPRTTGATSTEPARDTAKDIPKAGPSTPDATKLDPVKPGPAAPKIETPKVEDRKPDGPKPGAFGGGAQASSPQPSVSDGPIIDLKAKRLSDPAEAKPTTGPSATKPSDSSTFTPGAASGTGAKGADTKGADTKSTDAKPGSGPTPKIAASEPAARGPGFGSVAAAGLLGGVLGAGLLFAIERSGALGGGNDARFTALDQTIDGLAPKSALAALDTRIGANEAALKPLPEAVRAAEAAAKDALEKAGVAPAAAASNDGTPAAPVAALPPDLIARLDGLDQRVAALQEEPARDQSAGAAVTIQAPQALAALDERLKAVEGKVGDGKPGDGKSGASADVSAKLAALQGDLDSRTKANAEAGEALNQKLASLQQALDARVKAATEAVQAATQASQQAVDAGKAQAVEAAKAVERQLQAQSDKIAGLDQALAGRAEVGTVQAALRIVSADRIVTALNAGTPFAEALAALRSLEPGEPARLTAVAAFADKGAPTARSLAAEFRAIAERIAASRKAAQAKSVAETGDITQRLRSMAESIVQVRKVDTPAAGDTGTGTPDALPAVQDALDRGGIREAAKAFATLSDDIKAQAGEFGAKLASRAAAGEAAQALLSDAFKALPATGVAR